MKRYRVTFNGNINSGIDVETVKKNLAVSFKLNEKQIERLFSGQPILIKKDADYQTACKYIDAFKRAGATCNVETSEIPTTAEAPDATYDNESSAIGKRESMTCPKCGYEQEQSPECMRCGLVIRKMQVTTTKHSTVYTELEDSNLSRGQGRMQFRSDRSTSVVAGAIVGFMALCNLLMAAAFAADHGPNLFLSLLGVLLIFISIAAITYTNVATIDKETNQVKKTTRTLFWTKTWIFRVSDFTGVGIAIAGGTAARYFVQLLGPKIMNLPGCCINRQEGLEKARRIARFLNLPVDEKPGICIVGRGRL